MGEVHVWGGLVRGPYILDQNSISLKLLNRAHSLLLAGPEELRDALHAPCYWSRVGVFADGVGSHF